MAKLLLWEIRKERNLTLKEVSELTGISKTMLNYYENGRVSPRLETLEGIARGLECRISNLYSSEYK